MECHAWSQGWTQGLIRTFIKRHCSKQIQKGRSEKQAGFRQLACQVWDRVMQAVRKRLAWKLFCFAKSSATESHKKALRVEQVNWRQLPPVRIMWGRPRKWHDEVFPWSWPLLYQRGCVVCRCPYLFVQRFRVRVSVVYLVYV